MVQAIGHAALAILFIVVAILLIGLWVLPHVLQRTNTSGNHDLPVVMAVVLAMLAALVCHRLGLSPALGAFVAGLALADSPFARQIRSDVSVLKAVFLTLFFASIGTLADVSWLMHEGRIWMVLGVAGALVVSSMSLLTLGLTRDCCGKASANSVSSGNLVPGVVEEPEAGTLGRAAPAARNSTKRSCARRRTDKPPAAVCVDDEVATLRA